MAKKKNVARRLLDTSIFYERIKLDLPSFSSKMDRLAPGQSFGVYYSIIELNSGLLKNWVDFYKLVEDYQDVASAMAEATNWWGRSSGSVSILHSLNARINAVVSCDDVDRYLDYLENSIRTSVIIFEDMVRQFIGEFAQHPLSQFLEMRRNEYDGFIDTCEVHKIVPMGDYLKSQEEKLKALSTYIDEELTRHNTQRNRNLKTLIESAITKPLDADKPTNNKKYGDLLIALNSPKSHVLISKDTAFEILCTGLSKQYANFS